MSGQHTDKHESQKSRLFIYGLMITFLLISSFAIFNYLIPVLVSLMLDEDNHRPMIPNASEALKSNARTIQTDLGDKRDLTLEGIERSFIEQNMTQGRLLINTLAPWIEKKDYDQALAMLSHSIQSNPDIVAIAYRFRPGDRVQLLGENVSVDLFRFDLFEDNEMIYIELSIFVKSAPLVRAEYEEKSSFSRIEKLLTRVNEQLEAQILEDSHHAQSSSIQAQHLFLMTLALLGVVVQAIFTLWAMNYLIFKPIRKRQNRSH